MGQGWGIDLARGGMRTYAAMRRTAPDFFIHCGDNIYADCPIAAEQKLRDGGLWRNIVTEEKSKPAATLADYRGNYKYNLLDDNLRAFNAAVPTVALWDNHEVMESWWPGRTAAAKADRRGQYAHLCRARAAGVSGIHADARVPWPSRAGSIAKFRTGRCSMCSCSTCAATAASTAHADASYRPDDYLLGPAQVAWLKRELARSRATWKVIAADSPISYVSRSPGVDSADVPRGRGIEIADLLSFIKHAGIRNTLWITADLHYTAAHFYDPNRAAFQDFAPFWEFVSGPIHAGTWTPVDAGPHFRAAGRVPKGRQSGAGRQPSPLLWAAILRSNGDRRRDRLPDRHAQGRRGPRAMVDRARPGAAGANEHDPRWRLPVIPKNWPSDCFWTETDYIPLAIAGPSGPVTI